MKRFFGYLIAVILPSLIFLSCSQKKVNTTKTEEVKQVKVQKMQHVEIDRSIELPASLSAWEEVHLAPSMPGRIKKFFVDVSDVVKKGDKLLEMDKTNLLQSELQLQNLATEYERAKILYQSGSYSKQNFEQIETQYKLAKTSYENLKENTILKAPFSGLISGKYFEDGEMYSGTPNALVGKAAVLSIVNVSSLKTIIAIPESYFPLVSKNMEAKILCDVYPSEVFEAKVNIKYPIVNAATRTFDTELKIENKTNKLRPGMFARCKLFIGKDKAVLVPDNAVIKTQGSNERAIFVAENGIARRIVVKIGNRFNDKVELISDELTDNMQIVVVGQGKLNSGDKINIVE